MTTNGRNTAQLVLDQLQAALDDDLLGDAAMRAVSDILTPAAKRAGATDTGQT